MTRGRRQTPRKPIAPWLMGLILAAILFVIALFVFDLLGYGDDPSVGAIAEIQSGSGIGLPLQSSPSAGR